MTVPLSNKLFIGETQLSLVPMTGRIMNTRPISVVWDGKHVVGDLVELRNGDISPQSQRRLELNVTSLQAHGFAWGVYHRAPKAKEESARLTEDVPERQDTPPALRPELVLTPGVEVSVYHHHRHSLFIETPVDKDMNTFCYQVLDHAMLLDMLVLYNLRLSLTRPAGALHFIRIDYGELDQAIESRMDDIMSSRDGLLLLLSQIASVLQIKSEQDLSQADVPALRQAARALYAAAK